MLLFSPNLSGLQELFLKHGASLEIQDDFGRSPLLAAAKENSEAIAGLLLTHGARVDCQDHYGRTPLHWAVKNNNVKMAHSLLQCGANVGITSKQGLTPEDQAGRLGDNQGGELRELFRDNRNRRAQEWASSTESLPSVNSH